MINVTINVVRPNQYQHYDLWGPSQSMRMNVMINAGFDQYVPTLGPSRLLGTCHCGWDFIMAREGGGGD